MFACISSTLFAQLQDGTIAPDFTLTDINGETYNLYDELNAGKSVILDISATWCGPCWNYHTSGVLEDLYDDLGPNGTDQIRIFMVEGESDTNLDCLYGSSGCNDSSWGDWVTGTHYPIFSPEPAEADAFVNAYALGFWPTIYGISPIDKTVQLIGLASYNTWEGWLIDSWQMNATATTTDSNCPNTGSADLNVNLGFGSLDYEWSNGATTEDLVNVPAGNYTVTISDDHGVDFILDDIIVGGTSAANIEVNYIGIEGVDCNGNNSGSIDVFASGGAGAFSYEWSNGAVGSYLENLSGGDYEVTATDISGCQAVETFTIAEPEVLALSLSLSNTVCGEDNGSALLFADGGTGPYTYDIGMGGQNGSSFNSLIAGSYLSEITDVNGCNTQKPFNIDASVAPVAMVEAEGAIDCNTSNVVLTAANSTASGSLDYIWSTTEGEIVGSNQTESITVSAEGEYSLMIVELETGCLSTAEISVEDNTAVPTISVADVDMITCENTQVTLDASMSDTGDDLTYIWSTEDGNILDDADNLAVEVNQGGSYTLTISDGNSGCVATETVTVIADNLQPTIEVNDEELTCAVTEAVLCANVEEGHIVRWDTAAGVVLASCITVSISGEYVAIVEAPNGCTNSAVSTVTVSNDLPEVSVNTLGVITCTQESITIEADIVGDVTDHTIIWSDANGDVLSDGVQNIEVTESGEYELVVTNALGCSVSTKVLVEENINNPIAGFDYSLDDDGVVTLQSTSAEGGFVTWKFEDGTELLGDEATISLANGGEYEVCMTYANECGSDDYCQTIVYSVLLAVNIEKSDLTCFQSGDGYIYPNATGGAAGYTYLWIGPDGFISAESNLFDLDAGQYSLSIVDESGAEITTEVTLTEPEALGAINEVVANVSCKGDEDGNISMNIIGGTGSYQYEWSDGNMEISRADLSPGDYVLNVTDEVGCELNKTYTVLEPEELLPISILISAETGDDNNGRIEIEMTGGAGQLTYLWSNGDTTSTIVNLDAGEYSVIITDENGCTYYEDGIVVESLTDITDLNMVDDFSMYPIPANSFLNVNATLNGEQKLKINIVDSKGSPVWSTSDNTSEITEVIDLSDFATGVYSLSIISENSIRSENFIVIK